MGDSLKPVRVEFGDFPDGEEGFSDQAKSLLPFWKLKTKKKRRTDLITAQLEPRILDPSMPEFNVAEKLCALRKKYEESKQQLKAEMKAEEKLLELESHQALEQRMHMQQLQQAERQQVQMQQAQQAQMQQAQQLEWLQLQQRFDEQQLEEQQLEEKQAARHFQPYGSDWQQDFNQFAPQHSTHAPEIGNFEDHPSATHQPFLIHPASLSSRNTHPSFMGQHMMGHHAIEQQHAMGMGHLHHQTGRVQQRRNKKREWQDSNPNMHTFKRGLPHEHANNPGKKKKKKKQHQDTQP